MRYTELMAKIDDKFKERDIQLSFMLREINKLKDELKIKDDTINLLMRDNAFRQMNECKVFGEINKIKNFLEAIDQTLDGLTEEEPEDDECDEECTCDAVDIGEEIKKFLQGFAYKPKKKD